ncbi:MAG: hypothetical protein KDE69_11455, partial [Burkholderiaceae bacterium]|nr:hypothetical protein [Burkholderiaceae bacterium]
ENARAALLEKSSQPSVPETESESESQASAPALADASAEPEAVRGYVAPALSVPLREKAESGSA